MVPWVDAWCNIKKIWNKLYDMIFFIIIKFNFMIYENAKKIGFEIARLIKLEFDGLTLSDLIEYR